MRELLQEVTAVLAYSTKTQVALIAGILFFALFMIGGAYMASTLELEGPLALLTSSLRERILRQYDKAAWIALASFLLLTIRCYRKDRKRLLDL
jgi:hypothetical protein